MYYAARLSAAASLVALPSPTYPPFTNFSFYSLSLLLSLIDWLSLMCPFSLRVTRLSTAASFVALLPPASLSSKQALHLFSNSLTAWLSLAAHPFSLDSAVSKRLPSLCSNVH